MHNFSLLFISLYLFYLFIAALFTTCLNSSQIFYIKKFFYNLKSSSSTPFPSSSPSYLLTYWLSLLFFYLICFCSKKKKTFLKIQWSLLSHNWYHKLLTICFYFLSINPSSINNQLILGITYPSKYNWKWR